jgi:hypothetical protein
VPDSARFTAWRVFLEGGTYWQVATASAISCERAHVDPLDFAVLCSRKTTLKYIQIYPDQRQESVPHWAQGGKAINEGSFGTLGWSEFTWWIQWTCQWISQHGGFEKEHQQNVLEKWWGGEDLRWSGRGIAVYLSDYFNFRAKFSKRSQDVSRDPSTSLSIVPYSLGIQAAKRPEAHRSSLDEHRWSVGPPSGKDPFYRW